MDSDVLNNKLESLTRCVHRIESHTPLSLKILQSDEDMQDIVVLNLERAVQLCVDIGNHLLLDYEANVPQSMADTFRELAKQKIITDELAEHLAHAVGFRNIAVHRYQDIDWNIVMSIITKNIPDFRRFAGYVSNLMFNKN